MKNLLFILVFVLATGITYVAEAQKKSDPVVHFKSNMDCVDCEIGRAHV